jgi:hypothetical protein
MADQNPTDAERVVPLDLPDEHTTLLRGHLDSCLEGLRGDLETPELLRDPDKDRRTADAYERLMAGLEQGEMVIPDEAAREAMEGIAVGFEQGTNYAALVTEHDAIYGLLARLEGRAG